MIYLKFLHPGFVEDMMARQLHATIDRKGEKPNPLPNQIAQSVSRLGPHSQSAPHPVCQRHTQDSAVLPGPNAHFGQKPARAGGASGRPGLQAEFREFRVRPCAAPAMQHRTSCSPFPHADISNQLMLRSAQE